MGLGPLPTKLIVLFGLLAAAALAYRFRLAWLRFPILLISVGYLGFFEGSCLCPNGAMQNIALAAGNSTLTMAGIYFLEIGVLFAAILLFGNIYCGWVCHKGGVRSFSSAGPSTLISPNGWTGVSAFSVSLLRLYPGLSHSKRGKGLQQN